MVALATSTDVAHALGLANAAALSASQALRVAALLARVSREFRLEAERQFGSGTTTVRLLTVAGRLRLVEPVSTVNDVDSVSMLDCYGDTVNLEYTLDGQTLLLEHNGCALPSGVQVTVVYTHSGDIPEEVVAAVAAIVGRNLTVDPNSVAAQAVDLAAGPFRTRYADWTSNTSLLTEQDCELAKSYRYPGTAIIIQKP